MFTVDDKTVAGLESWTGCVCSAIVLISFQPFYSPIINDSVTLMMELDGSCLAKPAAAVKISSKALKFVLLYCRLTESRAFFTCSQR